MNLNRNSDLIEKSAQRPSAVEAVLNYIAPTKERPRTYTNDPPPPVSRAQPSYQKLTWCQSGTCDR